MKKALSILLCGVLLLCSAIPACAAVDPVRTGSQTPIIFLAGDGETIYNENDEPILRISENGLLGMFGNVLDDSGEEGGEEKTELYTSIANVLMPFLVQGLLMDDWDPYYENLEKEIGDLYAEGRLDDNGDAPAGTGISSSRRATNESNAHRDKKGANGYGMYSYQFWYDWRLDPLEVAVQLHDYIADVKAATHSDKVALATACLGTNVALAYLSLYGTEDLSGVGILASLNNGSEFLSQAISGKFHLDMDALNRILTDTNEIDDDFDMPAFATATLDLLSKSGAYGALSDTVKNTIYEKVVEGVTSAFALSTIFTMPCYWACVSAEDYDDALLYVFGEEGSEKREKYAGLIEKIERYHNEVALKADELLQDAVDSGVNLAILCKYGFQIVPICQDNDLVSDQYVSVNHSSFGATTSTIYDTLSDEYIASRVAEGKGKYISPDKKVDASTCLFPDYTWFTKNATHTLRTDAEVCIMYTVMTADRQMTVDDFNLTQFMVYDTETETTAPMTTENCDTEHWTKDEMKQPTTDKKTTIFNGLLSFFKWIVAFVQFLQTKLAK